MIGEWIAMVWKCRIRNRHRIKFSSQGCCVRCKKLVRP